MVLGHASGVLAEHRDPHRDLSGSRASLPRPSPLRTGRDDCSSSGSSLCRPVPGPRMVRMVAPPVYQLQVVQLVRSAVTARYGVVFVDEWDVLVRVEPYATHGAPVVLPSQQARALRRSQRLGKTPASPQRPVVLILGVQRTAFPLDLAVPRDGDLV